MNLQSVEPFLIDDVVDQILEDLRNTNRKEEHLGKLCELSSSDVRHNIVKLLPVVSSYLSDTSKNVKAAANRLIEKIIENIGNKDLEPFLPLLMESFRDISKSAEAIESLAGCVFVQNVTASTLAVMVPILRRGLRQSKYEVQRKSCIIIDNVCRLVDDPTEIYPFIPEIYPLVHRCSNDISHPEVRKIAERACKTIEDLYDENSPSPLRSIQDIQSLFEKQGIDIKNDEKIVTITKNLCNRREYDQDVWKTVYKKYLTREDWNDLCQTMYDSCRVMTRESDYEDKDEGYDLYKGEFSLAYGTLTLLRSTFLHLKKNRFYGLLGPNNCGKTTLMRAIANEQVEGFPKKDVLKTVFVEHEIQEREVGEDEHKYPIYNTDLCGIDWVMDYVNIVSQMSPPVSRDQVEKTMTEIGFGKERAADMNMPVTSYSGGWKMKMQLCAASLMNADILMLDEPTGHLDVINIRWLKDWLRGFLQAGGSVITTSHDSAFLNEMVTHIIDFHKKKLVMFKGNLNDFVTRYPEKKGYFELKNDIVRFTFPEPGMLEGVKSISRSILKMSNVSFTYPTRSKPTVTDISLECSRISRVAVIGPNGAGKSTAIKLLINELQPSSGLIQKHPNLRLAYVAQHAFFHLEKHLTKTPVQYIMWRFSGNEDKEGIEFINKKKTDEQAEQVQYIITKNGELREYSGSRDEESMIVEPEYIISRHENKKEKKKEYEVKWKNRSSDTTTWVDREVLLKMGAEKMVQKFDEREAMAQGLMNKALTTKVIENHLMQFGIEPEYASHMLIRSLSGGQKIKVVLAAALWQNPHLIILDEPTNYLDRDSLGALVAAIRDFKGGVIIISHNREFADAVCQEKWIMEGGRLRREGESLERDENKNENKPIDTGETILDSFGNEIKVEKRKELSKKEKTQEMKRLKKLISEGKKKKTLSEDEILDYELKLEELIESRS